MCFFSAIDQWLSWKNTDPMMMAGPSINQMCCNIHRFGTALSSFDSDFDSPNKKGVCHLYDGYICIYAKVNAVTSFFDKWF